MKNDIDKLILGLVIGGLLGSGAFYFLKTNKKEKKIFFEKIKKIMAEIGELLKESSTEDKNAAFDELIKNIPKKGNLANLMIMAAIGINLWKKWR